MLELMDLNDRQRAAAENLDGHILLTAPAGTGKTDTLAYRIANILESGRAEPEEVLCLTFTNKACQEMRERIERRAGEPGSRVYVKTFHSFCYDVIKSEAKRHLDLFADFVIFDEVDCRTLLREIMPEDLDVPAETLARVIAAKTRGKPLNEKDYKRLSDALLRRGFSWGEVKTALRTAGAALTDADDGL